LLVLRAGLHGRPLSLQEAAPRLGISSARAARLERTGLRTLSVTCAGGQPEDAPPGIARLAAAAPTLQPASFIAASAAPALQPAVDLAKAPRGSHAVEAATATSIPASPGTGRGPLSAATAAPFESSGNVALIALLVALMLSLLGAAALLVLRRRAVAGTAPAAAPAAPEPSHPAAPPGHDPIGAPAPPPSVPAQPRPSSNAARAATVIATSAVGFVVRELVRRHRR
jgi:hypothetical protein